MRKGPESQEIEKIPPINRLYKLILKKYIKLVYIELKFIK